MANLIDLRELIEQVESEGVDSESVFKVKAGELKNYATHTGSWNDKDEMAKLEDSLKDLGWEDTEPAILKVTKDKVFLIDGNHRLSIILKLRGENYLVPLRIEHP